MKTIASTKPVWAILVMAAALVLASGSAIAAPASDSGALMPPTVTGGDTDQIDNAETDNIREPQVVDPDIREFEVSDVSVPDVEAPDISVPEVEAPDVSLPEVEAPGTD
jgi:hypothetical protein